mmetsp:Transcript_31310/g.58796  ORF Transcript_31310/g.58796 Transcript_31310/m.58796 type:complete len:280 (+) Transcript_31310:928-1767(+)
MKSQSDLTRQSPTSMAQVWLSALGIPFLPPTSAQCSCKDRISSRCREIPVACADSGFPNTMLLSSRRIPSSLQRSWAYICSTIATFNSSWCIQARKYSAAPKTDDICVVATLRPSSQAPGQLPPLFAQVPVQRAPEKGKDVPRFSAITWLITPPGFPPGSLRIQALFSRCVWLRMSTRNCPSLPLKSSAKRLRARWPGQSHHATCSIGPSRLSLTAYQSFRVALARVLKSCNRWKRISCLTALRMSAKVSGRAAAGAPGRRVNRLVIIWANPIKIWRAG